MRETEYKKVFNAEGHETFYTTNTITIYRSLANDLIAKKINKCTYIKSIKRQQLYTGFINIIIKLDLGYKIVYHVKE